MLSLVDSKTPWIHEPDYWSEWIGSVHLIAVRNTSGAWLGYIGVPKSKKSDLDRLDDKDGHHGWNWAGDGDRLLNAGGRETHFYLGFDCNHVVPGPDGAADFTPQDAREKRTYRTEPTMWPAKYRTLVHVATCLRRAAVKLRKQQRWWRRLAHWLWRRT